MWKIRPEEVHTANTRPVNTMAALLPLIPVYYDPEDGRKHSILMPRPSRVVLWCVPIRYPPKTVFPDVKLPTNPAGLSYTVLLKSSISSTQTPRC